MKICSIFFRRKDACRKLKIETVRVFVAQKKKTIDRETTYGENFIFLRTRYSCEVSRGKLPTSMRYFGNEKIKNKKKKKDTLVGKVSILQPERGIRIKWIIFRADSSNWKSEQKFEVETP